MALAFLRNKGKSKDAYQFIADVGSNLFYQFKIGKRKRVIGGVEVVTELRHVSPIFQLKPDFKRRIQTDFTLAVPIADFKYRARYIQLFSYKNREGKSPAISDVLRVIPASLNLNSEFLKDISLATSENFDMENFEVQHKSFCYTEQGISESMFWDKIVAALPQVIGAAAPFISKLVGGGKKKGDSSGSTDDKILKAIAELVGKVAENSKKEAQKPAEDQETAETEAKPKEDVKAAAKSLSILGEAMVVNPAMLVQLAPLLQKVMSPETIKAIGNQPVKLFKAIGDTVLKMDKQEMDHLEKLNPGVDDATILPILQSMSQSRYATAKVAPALLAALPALMPLISKVLDPKMIQAIGDQPLKLFKAIGDAALKMDKQEMEHLERLNPGVDDPTIVPLLASMSIPQYDKSDIKFKMSPKIDLEFMDSQTIDIGDTMKVVYVNNKPIRIPVRVYTKTKNSPSRPMPKAIIQLIIQDGDSMKVLLNKKINLKNVIIGEIINEIIIDNFEVDLLPTNRDLKVEVSFIWKGAKSKKNTGTFKNHYIFLTNEYSFHQIGGPTGSPILLNDLVKYRAFWHKVWEGGYKESKRWEIDYDFKYYYALDPDIDTPSKLSTRRQVTSDNAIAGESIPSRRKVDARLKSGMELNLPMLNKLMPLLGYPMLNEAKLEALKSDEMKKYIDQVARISIELKGKDGQSSALWVYPEVNIHEISLVKATQVNPNGRVTQTTIEKVKFPRLSSIHVIGTKSK